MAPNQDGTTSQHKPNVVGIYGLPGVGKSELVRQLEYKLDRDAFQYFEGAQTVNELTKSVPETCQSREQAGETTQVRCGDIIGFATGRRLSWPESELEPHHCKSDDSCT